MVARPLMPPTPLQTEAILSASDLALSFGRHAILDGATLAIYPGEKVGLVGRNGCGKSSFLRIAAGAEQPDAGIVSRRQGLVVGYLPQEFSLDEKAAVEANIRQGSADLIEAIERYEHDPSLSAAESARLLAFIEHGDGWNLESRIELLRRELAAPPGDRVVAALSGGEKRRVGLCRALLPQPDLLILDEPTNHLDASAIAWLEGWLAGTTGACLFVTHDRYFLDRIATRIVELADGRFFSHEGNYSDYLIAKAARQERDEAAEHKRQRFLSREIEWVRAGVKARGTKQRSRLDQYYAVKAQKAPEKELDMDLVIPTPPPLANVVVELSEVGHFYGRDPLFLGLDLEFKAGECVGVVGPNGVGKTTLLKIILGELEPTAGTVRIGKRTEFNYVDQTRLSLDEDKSVLEEVSQGQDSVRFGDETISVRSYLQRFLFGNERINDRIGNLSGGEKNRVLLAKILRRGGNFLVLDEPTNDLDLQTLRVLEEALVNFGGTALVVSHDRWFLDRVCDRVIVFEGNGRVSVNEGNYSYYLEKRRASEAAAAAAAKAKPAKTARPADNAPEKPDKPRKLKWKEERELEAMEETILAAESAVAELEEKLNDPSFYIANAAEAPAMIEDLERQKAAVAALYSRWEELEAIRALAEAGGGAD
jgi:ATP-binding cassette subfamily F protein uup